MISENLRRKWVGNMLSGLKQILKTAKVQEIEAWYWKKLHRSWIAHACTRFTTEYVFTKFWYEKKDYATVSKFWKELNKWELALLDVPASMEGYAMENLQTIVLMLIWLISIIQKDIYESTILCCFNAFLLFLAILAHCFSVEHFLN